MESPFWEGVIVVEGIPEYDALRAAINYLRDSVPMWVQPVGYDGKADLTTFSLLVDLDRFRPERLGGPVGRRDDEAGRANCLKAALEDILDAVVELEKTDFKMGSPWLLHAFGANGRKYLINMESREEFEMALGTKAAEVEPSLESALRELDTLVGLDEVKRRIKEIVSLVQRRGKDAVPCLHMAFVGNPGTGKTEVARICGKIFRALGVLRSGQFIETDRSGLVGQYIGETAQKTMAVLGKADGGVLFIDEAYSLGLYHDDLGLGPDGEGGRRDFGPEAIDVLVKQMEDHRNDFSCIMAGYPREMERMIGVNPGLRDRISMTIEFPDYSKDELADIFELMVRERGYDLTPEVRETFFRAVSEIAGAESRTFGNARFVRKILERVIMKQNLRATDYAIEECDVLAAFGDQDIKGRVEEPAGRPIGFAAA